MNVQFDNGHLSLARFQTIIQNFHLQYCLRSTIFENETCDLSLSGPGIPHFGKIPATIQDAYYLRPFKLVSPFQYECICHGSLPADDDASTALLYMLRRQAS